ncbi:uncharacterized protein G2W53_010671 [Senna tora]|uniref:Uncharacterized protein n=1 Tax=Senna tora TaxID=362788 RepID=A0A834X1F3_9FABA|nr:uncharacterized protein G2W53_010671 [Senna tora]
MRLVTLGEEEASRAENEAVNEETHEDGEEEASRAENGEMREQIDEWREEGTEKK